MSAPHTAQLFSQAAAPGRSTSSIWAQSTRSGLWLHAERSQNSKVPAQVSVLLDPTTAIELGEFLIRHGTRTIREDNAR